MSRVRALPFKCSAVISDVDGTLVEPLGITTPLGGFNGGVIATPDLTVVSQHLLLPQIARLDRVRSFGGYNI